ncbi:alkaline phosphatase [Hydrococcus rivularis NIES-593]|uniref:Alkaline phosphatase n=1 Tax=Hydrococcus rivularis NIES-593 TaxID=1921803 RepID=A0A1U7HTC1_9CYAN|nr:alkaline phosphatase D family protein [Hydrococcus rivularis]OKH26788.1 alkaline phosphatase [Hydrococcus rivularis NIES-593]
MNNSFFNHLLSTRLKRRNLLLGAGVLGGLAITNRSRYLIAQPKYSDYPFSLGVASGEPDSNSVVLWTRLAPNPRRGNALPSADIPLQWQVATDEKMRRVVAKGVVSATPEWAHSVRVVVEGLESDRWYWYQFRTGNEVSPVGRTRTCPAPTASSERLSFAFASCQNYEHGYFNAYRHMSEEEIDFVIHLGDYIYEGGGAPRPDDVRSHGSPEPMDLEGYRRHYALYRSDRDLQEAHRLFPFICTWDDHEVDNDYANLESQDFDEIAAFAKRRAAAYQAYYEHLPFRPASRPQGDRMQLYRRFSWGNLALFHVLDTRQYRDDQACDENGDGGGQVVECQERLAEARSLLGQPQEQWLLDGLTNSSAHWDIIAQQYLVAQLKQQKDGREGYWSDGWDGYAANRKRILDHIAQQRPSNPIFIGGDIHSFWVSELKPDFQDPASPTVACEFVGTSISSNGVPYEQFASVLPENPHIKFFESRLRGYVKCAVSRQEWRSDLRVVDTVKQQDSKVSTLATFIVEDGNPQVRQLEPS